MNIDKLQGYTFPDLNLPTVNTVWLECLQHLPGRIKAICSNIKLLRKCAEDAKKDAQLWASRSEGDGGKEFEEPEEQPAISSGWRPSEIDMRFSLHEFLTNRQELSKSQSLYKISFINCRWRDSPNLQANLMKIKMIK